MAKTNCNTGLSHSQMATAGVESNIHYVIITLYHDVQLQTLPITTIVFSKTVVQPTLLTSGRNFQNEISMYYTQPAL